MTTTPTPIDPTTIPTTTTNPTMTLPTPEVVPNPIINSASNIDNTPNPQINVPHPHTNTSSSTELSLPSIHETSPSSYISTPLPLLNITNFVTTKFDGTNYLLWKSQFESILYTTDLFGHVDGSIIQPPQYLSDQTTINPDFVHWRRRDRYVMICLNATFTKPIAQQVFRLSTAAEIWNQLNVIYLQEAKSTKTMFKEKLSYLRKGSSTITEYMNELMNIADSLASINCPIDEDDLIIHALNGLALDSNYDILVVTLQNQIHSLTLSGLRSSLLVHEKWLLRATNMRSTHLDSNTPSAFTSQARNPYSNQKSQKRASSSTPPQHHPNPSFQKNTQTRTPSYSNNQNQSNPGYSNMVQGYSNPTHNQSNQGPNLSMCQICKKTGHGAYNCRFRYFPKTDNRASSSSSSSIMGQPPLHQAFNSMHISHNNDDKASTEQWITDSGANTHMTNNSSFIQGAQPFEGPDQVMLGDGPSYRSGAP